MAAHQAPPSLGFSRQEHWSGLPFPSPMHESEKWKWSRSVMSDSSDPMDCSLPGSSIHGIFQARVLGWGAIAFSPKLPTEVHLNDVYPCSTPSCQNQITFLVLSAIGWLTVIWNQRVWELTGLRELTTKLESYHLCFPKEIFTEMDPHVFRWPD